MALSSTDSEARIYRNASPGLRFFLAAGLSVTLMLLDHRGNYLEEVRRQLGAAMYPLQVAIDSPAAGLRWARENLALRSSLLRENALLRQQALEDGARLQRLAALQAENGRIRALLDARARIPDKVTVAEILSVDMDPLRHRVIVNRGSRLGAAEGQALLDANGVVGQITRDQFDSAEALLITDPDHAVPVEIVRNGLRTIAAGTGDPDQLSLPYLTRNADVRPGDLLVTSGLGGTFPAGYPVGTVSKVDNSSGDAFLEVYATPAARLDRLHEVLLLVTTRPAPVRPVAPQPEPAVTEPSPAAQGQQAELTVPQTGPSPPPMPQPQTSRSGADE